MRAADEDDQASPFRDCLTELEQNHRVRKLNSHALVLATSFAGTPEPDDANVWESVARGEDLGDLRTRYWQDADELHRLLLDEIQQVTGELCERAGVDGDARNHFNATLGHDDAFDASTWQVIVPIRGGAPGSGKLNAVVQDEFHGGLKFTSAKRWGVKFGDERLTTLDKVMQISNQRLKGYRSTTREREPMTVFNGQLGTVRGEWPSASRYKKGGRPKLLHVEFDGLPGVSFSYASSGWLDVDRHLELAYAITVHKSQGSQFNHVFFVLPRAAGDFVGRELVDTGLTRAQDRLTLFVEKDVSTLLPLRKRAAAQTPRRRSRLFEAHAPGIDGYRADSLIHVTARDELVRSKSEVILANALDKHDLSYNYEQELLPPGGDERDMRLPDFTIMHKGVAYYWEHCGMTGDADYMRRWEEVRLPWYKRHGLADRLIVTYDGADGSIDSTAIEAEIARLKAL